MKSKTFFKCPVVDRKTEISISFPKEILDAINAKDTVNCVITDGILQISGSEPFLSIPFMSLDKAKFVPIR